MGTPLPFLGGGAGSPRPTSIPSGFLIHAAIWPQQIWAEGDVCSIDREFVTSAKKSRILTNFPKLKKFVKIRTKIR